MPNFKFLNKKWPSLAKLGEQAKSYIYTDNNVSMLKMRMFGEQIIDCVLTALRIEVDRFATQDDKIKLLRDTEINSAIPDLFDIVRRYGNKANYQAYDNFYNEPQFVKRLFELTNANEVSETSKEQFVRIVVTCYGGS